MMQLGFRRNILGYPWLHSTLCSNFAELNIYFLDTVTMI